MKRNRKIIMTIIFIFTFVFMANVSASSNTTSTFEELSGFINDENSSKTIVLGDDIVMPDDQYLTIKTGQSVTIDLNGHSLSFKSTLAKSYAAIVNNGTLVIKDATDTKKDGSGLGVLSMVAEKPDTELSPKYASNVINNNGIFTLESGLLKNATPIVQDVMYRAANGIDNYSNGVITINGGKIHAVNCGVRLFVTSSTAANDIEVNGGIIEGRWGIELQVATSNSPKSNIEINGGIIDGSSRGLYVYDYSSSTNNINIEINDGKFISATADEAAFYLYSSFADVVVNGGTFNGDYAVYYYGDYKSPNMLVLNDGIFNGYILSYQGFKDDISNIQINGGMYAGDVWVYVYITNPYYYAMNTNVKFINGGFFGVDGNQSGNYWSYYVKDGFVATGEMKSLDKNFPYTIGHEIQLKANYDGGEDAVIYTLQDGKMTELYNFERAGYDFVGWNTKDDGSGDTVTSKSVINTNTILYAIWELAPGKKEVKVESEDFKEIKVDEKEILETVLTDEDKNKMKEGKDVTVHLNVEKMEKVVQEEKTAILSSLNQNDYKLGEYIDISLIKKIFDSKTSEDIPITKTNKPIKITISIPDDLINKNKNSVNRKYVIVRCHDGVVEYLDTIYNSKDNTLTFETDRFSTYSIAYKDYEKSAGNPDTGDNIGNYVKGMVVSFLGFGTMIALRKKSKCE